MKYKKFENRYVLRLDEGEEITDSIKKFCTEKNIESGFILGIGDAVKVSVLIFDTGNKKEIIKEFKGEFTITGLNGNISLLNGETFIRIFINFADTEFRVYGGELKRAVVNKTCEAIIVQFEEKIEREFNMSSGVNIYKL